ncbi:hypothetical protein [Prochlorococcus marinus]|uniref:hypothetical protein n=1 Tax=Prochlorococcus marinus TaxID=1219 RepID=UPI0022B397A5|nr:hypothetical protein [Prochlorococcus marinus]
MPQKSIDPNESIIHRTHKYFRLSRPDPYKDSNYFDWFIKQTWSNDNPECETKQFHDGKGYNLRQQNTPFCQGFTIQDGWRITAYKNKEYSRNIYIYGGSTIESSEVINKYTIPSYLQRFLTLNDYLDYGVHNRGFTSVVTSQQNDFLLRTPLKSGDIVIYYDGGNNIWNGVANADPKGTIIGSNKKNYWINSIKLLVVNLQTYKLFSQLKNQNNESIICDGSQIPNLASLLNRSNQSFDVYKNDLINARKISLDRGASFIHFFQPNLFSVHESKHTPYEVKLIESSPSEMIPCGAKEYLTTGTKVFQNRHKELTESGIISIDLSKLFRGDNNKIFPHEIFLDFIHVTEKGNQKVAEAIFNYLSINGLLTKNE